MGGAAADGRRGARRRGAPAPPRGRAHRRRHRGAGGGVRRGPVPGGHRRAADRHQRDGQPAGRGRAEPGLPEVPGRRTPLEHEQAGVRGAAPGCADRRAARARPGPELAATATGDRGLPAPGDDRAVRARPDPEVQEQEGPHAPGDARGAADPGAAPGVAGDRRPSAAADRARAVAAAGRGHRGRDAQERPAAGRGPGRRGAVRVRRALLGTAPGGDDDLRLVGRGLHRHPHARDVARAEPDPVANAVRAYAAQEPALRGAADQAVALVPDGPGRGRHQLPDHHRPLEDGRVVRGQGRPEGGRARRPSPTRWPRSATPSGCG